MAIWDLFSKREKRKRLAGKEDVFQYENLPESFRVQVIHIWHDAIGECRDTSRFLGPGTQHEPNSWWFGIYKVIVREKGVFQLSEQGLNDPLAQCSHYLMAATTEDALDIIELTFKFINGFIRSMVPYE